MLHSLGIVAHSRVIIDNSCSYSEDDLIAALRHMVRNGHVEDGWDGSAAYIFSIKCLKYLVSIGYEHKAYFPTEHAIEYNDAKMLRFLHKHGWPIDKCDFWLAISRESYDSASYLHKHGYCCYASFDRSDEEGEFAYREAVCEVVQKILLPKWRRITRVRFIAMYWQNQSGITAYAENGPGRGRDLNAFRRDFPTLLHDTHAE